MLESSFKQFLIHSYKVLVLIVTLVVYNESLSQNLVSNAGFEDTLVCPDSISQIERSLGWSTYGGTPDYFNECGNNYTGVPNNLLGSQYASSGKAYSGFLALSTFNNYREIIGRKLDSELIIGKRYFVSLKVSLSDKSLNASNNIGVAFATYSLSGSKFFIANNAAKVFSTNVITDYSGWQVISGSFIADSAYQYLMIGNFFGDSITSTIASGSPDGLHYRPYYYVDDVCVSIDSTCFHKVTINKYPKVTPVKLYPNPAINTLFVEAGQDNYIKRIIIYNMFGSKILEYEYSENDIQFLKSLDVSGLSQGQYQITIFFTNEVINQIILIGL